MMMSILWNIFQQYYDEYDVRLEENGTLSIQVTYEPKTFTFKTSFICGHMKAKQEKMVYEFTLPRGRIEDKMKAFEKQTLSFSLFDYVYYEGSSLESYYIGFSNKSLGSILCD